MADELGPAKIIYVQEPSIGLKGILVVDNVATGPSIGGLRMAEDVSTEECIRLARAMTLKNAAAGLSHGGGKSVLFADPKSQPEKKETLIRGFAHALRRESDYIFGPDMGTNEECMAWVKDEIGRAVGLPSEIGGIPLDTIGATGWGLFHAVKVALSYCDFELDGARLVIQGFGAVGKHAARFLTEQGAVLVGTSDSRGSLYDPDGLEVEALIELKAAGKSVIHAPRGRKGDADATIDMECDIWIPAARPDVLHEGNIHRLRTKLLAQGANIPMTYGAEQYLHQQAVLVLPDFIANAGGVICAAMEYQKASQSVAMQTIEEKIRKNTEEVLAMADSNGLLPREAALQLSRKRIRKAMSLKRWNIF
ncbi:Glu/Leu/Phe/Val family dehydrogenase [Desulfogranum mediterraneum]|uniref:Glu/Leu/Phe/Val family dehydrogenase n=1 Tax=Desulfogranum mediterraneum TaxID=160661 RepID=UPI001ABF6410